MNGHRPRAYLKDVLTRLPTQPIPRIEDLLPHLGAMKVVAQPTSFLGVADKAARVG